MKIVAIIQARMGSTRLPGKVLKQVLGRPLLAYQLERIGRSKYTDEILVATTDNPLDNEIVSLCELYEVPYFRGAENDVLTRYYKSACHVNADVVIRLTADCPLIDPEQIDKVVEAYLNHDHELQYASNILERTFPRGMDTEVFSIQALKKAYETAVSKQDREHVTRLIVNSPSTFKLINVFNYRDYSHHRWTVDTIEDLTLIKKIMETLYPQNPHFTMEDTIQLLKKNPRWQLINHNIKQKND